MTPAVRILRADMIAAWMFVPSGERDGPFVGAAAWRWLDEVIGEAPV
jgi:hypothetical protein